MLDDDFNKLSNPSYDLEADKSTFNTALHDCYITITEILSKYCDLEERYYPVISLWIIGSYAHDSFETYPYIFLNASKGSGKSRLLRLISILSRNGKLLGSITESALFRGAKGNTLCIDELEQINSDEKGALRELLNSAYKRGMTIERYRKKKIKEEENYVVEVFDVYTSLAMANISGMEKVLADRCITLLLEKSENKKITRLIEDFGNDIGILQIKAVLDKMKEQLGTIIKNSNISKDWNDHVLGTFREHKLNDELTSLFQSIDETEIEGRNLELLLPLYFIAYLIDDKKEALNTILKISKELIMEKEAEENIENSDKILRKFLVEKIKSGSIEYLDYISTAKISNQFKEYLGDGNDWVNPRWLGVSLKRMKIIKSKKRESNGIKVLFDLEKLK